MLTSFIVTAGFGSQLSLAVGVAAVGIDEQLAVVFEGTPANTGFVPSLTVITCA